MHNAAYDGTTQFQFGLGTRHVLCIRSDCFQTTDPLSKMNLNENKSDHGISIDLMP